MYRGIDDPPEFEGYSFYDSPSTIKDGNWPNIERYFDVSSPKSPCIDGNDLTSRFYFPD